jgi:hypothetical protein
MNEEHLEVILLGLEIVRDEEKYTEKREDVKYRKVWRRNKKRRRTGE